MPVQNNREDVYEIQKYLRTIQIANNETSLLNPDGVYGRETTDAVMAFQIRNNIPATGRVDSLTWDRIFSEFLIAREHLAQPHWVSFFPNGINEMKKGDAYDEIYALQVLLRLNDKRFGNPQILEITGIFDENTESAVKELQRVFGVTETGKVDKFLWNKAADFHNNRYLNESY